MAAVLAAGPGADVAVVAAAAEDLGVDLAREALAEVVARAA